MQKLADLINLWSRARVSELKENATSILDLIKTEISVRIQYTEFSDKREKERERERERERESYNSL